MRAAGLTVLTMLLTAPHVTAAPVTVDPAFGYRIGDRIVAAARVEVDERARLDAESLPRVGMLHGWLSLEEVTVEPEEGALRITRVFQVTASAPEPRLLYLPKVELKFTLDGRSIDEQLEAVPVTVAPLAPSQPVLRSGLGFLRPDRDVPDPRPEQALQRAAWLAAALALLALLWLGLRTFALQRRGFAPFTVASRRLRRLARAGRGATPATIRGSAFRIMHEAFNEAGGQAIFSSQRDRFLAEHPQFAGEAVGVRAFFDRSDALFFGTRAAGGVAGGLPHDGTSSAGRDDGPGGGDLAWLASLASRLARLEQAGSR